jgi:replicative DNA helicase
MTAAHPQTLPHSIDAERAVLAAILLDGRRYLEAGDLLAAEDFYRDAHQVLFGALLTLGKRGIEPDLLTLAHLLGPDGFERVGGASYVSGLIDGVPRSTSLPHHARIVAGHAKGRRLHTIARDLMAGVLSVDADLDAVQEAAEQGLRVLTSRNGAEGFVGGAAAADRMLARVEQWQETEALAGLPTGFDSLDTSTLGLHRTELIVVAGRPGMGKSAIVGQIAAHAALDLGKAVAWFTLEMVVEEVTIRIAAARAGIAYRQLMRGRVSPQDLARITEQGALMAASGLLIDDAFEKHVAQIRRACRLAHARRPLDLIVIDYLTLMDSVPGERHETRSREVGSWVKRLKGLAKELNVPVLLCCQLNREAEDGALTLKHLRDSGEIEQAANTVMFIHHEPVDGSDPYKVVPAEVIVAKQRHGPVGPVHLTFNGPLVRFEERS